MWSLWLMLAECRSIACPAGIVSSEEAVGVDLEGPRLCRDFVQRLFQPQHISRIHSATQPEYFLLHLRCFDYLGPVDRHPRACGVSGHRAITIGCNAALKPPGVPPSHQRIRYAG